MGLTGILLAKGVKERRVDESRSHALDEAGHLVAENIVAPHHHKQVLSEEWLRMATTPTPTQPTYDFMNFFLNTERKYLPSAPASTFAHVGNGTNVIYGDPENDVVVVARWIENGAVDGFIGRVLASVGAPAAEVKAGADKSP